MNIAIINIIILIIVLVLGVIPIRGKGLIMA